LNRFAFATPANYAQAGALLADKRFKLPVLKAGGLDVLDHLKEGLAEPDLLVNIRTLRTAPGAEPVAFSGGVLTIQATATLIDLVKSPLVQKHAPCVGQAVGSAATPQVRNVATAAGNLLQRPRCWYYRQEQFDCLKKGGETCFAVEGENKFHALFGDGPCHIVHPSNLAVALLACGATVTVEGRKAPLPVAELYHTPDKGVRDEANLKPGEIISAITVPAAAVSGFYAVKEKQSFDWPLAMAAVTLTVKGDLIESATVVLGAVAPVPWALPKVAAALKGVNPGDEAALKKACAGAVEGAKPMSGNAYKLRLLPVVVRRAVLTAVGKLPEELA
jgi:xanthine dehydrogenase YagS FAD-binding subunit